MMVRQWKKRASLAYGFSLARLALDAGGLVDAASGSADAAGSAPLYEELSDLLSGYLAGRPIQAEAEEFRSRVREKMKVLIAFSDAFLTLDYALARMERRFVRRPPVSLDGEAFLTHVTRYLTSTRDNLIVNQRIRDVVGQLPVRMTRKKFYSLVRDGLSVYIGSGRENLKDRLYELRSCGMMELSGEQRAKLPELDAMITGMEQVSYKELTGDRYMTLVKEFDGQKNWLDEALHECSLVMEMANDLYVLCLTGQDAVKDAASEEACLAVLTICARAKKEGIRGIPDEKMMALEGLQETYYEKYERLSPASEYREGEEAEARLSRVIDELMSSSTFVDIEREEDWTPLTAKELDQALEDYAAAADPVLAKVSKPVARAVMARSLAALPVFFQSIEEVIRYIGNCLGSCEDEAEKEASMRKILDLMESEGYEVV